MALSTNATTKVTQLYVAMFGRAPDMEGLNFWGGALDAGQSVAQVAQAMFGTTPARAYFPAGSSSEQVVQSFYVNVLGRQPDPEGLAFWVARLDALKEIGNPNAVGQVVTEIISIVANYQGNTPEGAASAQLFANKIEVANFWAAENGGADNSTKPIALVTADPASVNQVKAQILNGFGDIVANTTFTLKEAVIEGEPEVAGQKVVYWGYNPHNVHDDIEDPSGVPADGGVPVAEMLKFLTSITGLDLAELGLIDDDGVGPFDNVTNLTISNALSMTNSAENAQSVAGSGSNDSAGAQSPSLEIEYADGSFREFNIEAQIAESYFKFLNDLLFDANGNSRLFEVEVGGSSGSADTLQPIKLTPSVNNGGTIEQGYTTAGDDLIVAERVELLHQAYIDAGAGRNVLEIDAKGTYAQPTALLNIQEIRVNDLPNWYSTNYGSGDGNLGNTDFTGAETPGLTTDVPSTPFPSPTGTYSDNTWIDLNRAIHLDKLVVTDQGSSGDSSSGDLTIVGVRNGATLRLEGGFNSGATTIQYGQGQTGTLNVELAVGDVNAAINILQNASTMVIDSQGVENHLHQFFAGGSISRLIVEGTGAFVVEQDMGAGFNNESVLIDASANTGGVNLTLSGSQIVNVVGSQANDRFSIQTYEVETNPGNDEVVNIAGGVGNNYYEVIGADQVTITNGDGNNNYEITRETSGSNANSVTNLLNITAGNGDNHFEIDRVAKAVLKAGDGDNRIDVESFNSYDWVVDDSFEYTSNITVEVGNGVNSIDIDADANIGVVSVTAGNGGNDINVQAATISVTAGTGADDIRVEGRDVTVNAGGAGNTITVVGKDNDYTDGSNSALIKINAGSDSVVKLGSGQDPQSAATNPQNQNGDDFPGVGDLIAKEGSSITGTGLTLYVDTVADLRAATLSGISKIILDDDNATYINSNPSNTDGDKALLTLLDTQMTQLVTAGVSISVEGSIFNTSAHIQIIVTDDLDITTGAWANLLSSLPASVDFQFVINDGATLKLTAQQLHTKVAVGGITIANDGNTDEVSGKVYITGAGTDFDPFNSLDSVRTTIDGRALLGGSLGTGALGFATDADTPADGIQRNEWGNNVLIDRTLNGYNRPADAPSYSRLTISTDEQDGVVGPFQTIETFLRIVGEADMEFTPMKGGIDEWGREIKGGTAIALGVDSAGDPDTFNTFMVDFSSATGEITNLTLAHFQNADAIYGNGTAAAPVRVNVEIDGDGIVASATAGLVSRDVQEYVVTAINSETQVAAVGTLNNAVNALQAAIDADVVPTTTSPIAFNDVVLTNQSFSLTVGGVTVLNLASANTTVTGANLDAALVTVATALSTAGISYTGSFANDNIVFTRANGADLTVAFGGTPGGNNNVTSINGTTQAEVDALVVSAYGVLRPLLDFAPTLNTAATVIAYFDSTEFDVAYANELTQLGQAAQFWTSRVTEDLQTLGLRGNYDKTVIFGNTERGVDFLMEVAYDKFDGYAVGTLEGRFARPGADAVVNVVGLQALPAGEVQNVAGITLVNADTAVINVTGGNTVIESLSGADVESYTFTADADLTVEVAFINSTTEVVDGTGVAGDFNITVTGTVDLSDVDLLGVDQLVLQANANVTLSATQLLELADKIVDGGANTKLNVVELSDQALDLSAIDVDAIGTVTFADVDGTIEVNAATNFGDAVSVTILAQTSDTSVKMTAEQFGTITNGTVLVTEANANDATLVLNSLANNKTLNLDNVAAAADVVLQVSDLVATADMVITEDNQVQSIKLEVSGVVDLSKATLNDDIDAVMIAAGATLTLTAQQAADIGFADAWAGLAGATLNIVGLSDQVLNLDAVAAAGITIGTVTIANTNGAIAINPATTFGGAAEIITPTADVAAPEWGTERTSVTMTVDQFASSGGVISGDSQVNLTGLYNNVDTNGDFIPDSANFDLSGIANAGTITFADDTVNATAGVGAGTQHFVTLTSGASLGGFEIVLKEGDLIRFATEAQAAATITVYGDNSPVSPTGVQWLWTTFGAEVNTSGYDKDITTLFIDEALLVSQPREEDLWSELPGTIVVEKINGSVIPELIKYDRVNTFEAFTNIPAGINYDDDADFSTLSKLTMNLEGEVNLGNILLGDTNNGNGSTPNIDGRGFFTTLTINSYLDLSNNPELAGQDPDTSGRVIETNTIGNISLNAGSLDELVNVTIGTGDFIDAVNVNGAQATRDGLAVEVGTITFGANTAKSATLTLTGDNAITIAGVDISDSDISLLDINAVGYTGADAGLTIGGIVPTGGDAGTNDLGSFAHIYVVDGYTAPAATAFGVAGNNLLVVAGGNNDFTVSPDADGGTGGYQFNLSQVHVTANGTLTLTADQVAAIGTADGTDAGTAADAWSVAPGVTVTLNIVGLSTQALNLNAIQAAGFNIGTVSITEGTTEINAATTFGGADQVVIEVDTVSSSVEMTAAQFQTIDGTIEQNLSADAVENDDRATVIIDELEGIENATTGLVNIDLSTVNTTGANTVRISANTTDSIVTDGNGDVELAASADLGNFSVTLNDIGNAGTVDLLSGETIRFATAVQAERAVIVIGDEANNADQDTNVVWLFNTITGTAEAGKVDTSEYEGTLGRLWVNDQLVDGVNVEELWTSLGSGIIVRVVNTADLDELLPTTVGVSRTVEVEAFTQLPGGLVFNDEDLLEGVTSLTITLGGDVNMGNLELDNLLAPVVANPGAAEFNTLTINSFSASATGRDYLYPESWDATKNPATTGGNVIGDIGAGATREQLHTVVINATDVDITIGTITFEEEDLDGTPVNTATLELNGAQDVTITAIDTTDADITALVIDTADFTGVLDPVMNMDNTESFTIDGDKTADATVNPTDGAAELIFTEVEGNELSFINTADSAADITMVISQIDSTNDDRNEDGDTTDAGDAAFTFTAGTGTNDITLAQVGANVPTLAAGSDWVFTFTDSNTDSSLTINEEVVFGAGDLTLTMDDAELVINGEVDMTALTSLTISGAGDIVLNTADAVLLVTDELWLTGGLTGKTFVDANGDPAVLRVTSALAASLGGDLTLVRGYSAYDIDPGVTVTLREDQAGVAYVDGDDGNPGVLTGANVTVFVQETGFGDRDITDLTDVAALVIEADTTDNDLVTPGLQLGYTVTMTVAQADSLVGNITKNGNTVTAEAGDSGDGDPVDLTDPAGDGSEPAYDLSEVDTLYVEDDDGTIINLAQFNAIGGGANIVKQAGTDPVILIAAGDLSAEDLTGITSIIITGNTTLTAEQVAAIAAENGTITMDDPLATYSLSVTNAELLGADTTPADGFIDAGTTIDIDLAHVTVDAVTVGLLTTTIDPLDGVTQIDGNYTVTGDLNGATLALAGNGTVTMDVTVANGETITGTTATVNITDVASADDDFNGDEIHLENIAAAIAGTATLSEHSVLNALTNLGSFAVAIGAFNLTATAAQLDGVDVTGTGNVAVTALGSDAVDLSGVVTTVGTRIATLVVAAPDTATDSVTLDPTTDLGGFDINSGTTANTLTLTADQADGITVTDGGDLDDVVVTAFEDNLGADLTGLVSGGYDTDVQVDTTGANLVILAGADLSGLNSGSQVTVSGTGTLNVADESAPAAGDGADVATTDFVVNAGATLVSDFANVDTDSIIDPTHVTGAGTLEIIADDGKSITITDEIRYTNVIFEGADANVTITDFEAVNLLNGGFVYTADVIGRHTLELNAAFVTAGNEYEELGGGAIGATTGVLVYTGNIASVDEAGIEDLFDGTTANLAFNTAGDDLYLVADDGANTYIWLIQELGGMGGNTEFTEAEDSATLIATLTGVADATQLDVANFVGFI